MSRYRLSARLRTNADYRAMTAFLDAQGLRWELVKPNAKGHPALRIQLPGGMTLDHYIPSTPRGRCNATARVANLRRFLIDAGAINGARTP